MARPTSRRGRAGRWLTGSTVLLAGEVDQADRTADSFRLGRELSVILEAISRLRAGLGEKPGLFRRRRIALDEKCVEALERKPAVEGPRALVGARFPQRRQDRLGSSWVCRCRARRRGRNAWGLKAPQVVDAIRRTIEGRQADPIRRRMGIWAQTKMASRRRPFLILGAGTGFEPVTFRL